MKKLRPALPKGSLESPMRQINSPTGLTMGSFSLSGQSRWLSIDPNTYHRAIQYQLGRRSISVQNKIKFRTTRQWYAKIRSVITKSMRAVAWLLHVMENVPVAIVKLHSSAAINDAFSENWYLKYSGFLKIIIICILTLLSLSLILSMARYIS